MESRAGQTSVEYMMLAVFLTAALVVVLATSLNLFANQTASLRVAEARVAANELADMANFLCTAPKNTTSRRDVYIPREVNLMASSIGNRTIKLILTSKDAESAVTATTACNVTGTLPGAAGTYVFRGVSQGGSGGSVAMNYTLEVQSLRPSAG
ncbi:MAG: hypothetical protein HYS81_02780 [Candidatus Aenigmatarchaeota archaeon]|nr:MAG: hypothetical protein HYS81_02780 [Candidatus Aenigmarchaeota archaeon]